MCRQMRRNLFGQVAACGDDLGHCEILRIVDVQPLAAVHNLSLIHICVLNALPRSWRAPLIGLYNSLAWRIARKGL